MSMTTGTAAVHRLIAEYAELVDAGDFAGVGALFAEAVFVGRWSPIRGADGVEKMLTETVIRYEDGTPRTHHATSNLLVDLDEEAGTGAARSYVTVFQALPDFPLQAVATGRYRDRFVRRDGRWHFAERRVHIHLVGDVSRHLHS